ncbi:MAG TPA: hypothetical protein V6D26_08520 [Stenomitos sp.]
MQSYRINILRSQLALLQLALATDDLTPPVSAAVAAEEGMKQARKHSYPIPPLAETLAEGKPLTKNQFKQLQAYFEKNSWQGPAELLFNEDGTERQESPSPRLVEYLCWGSAGAEGWSRAASWKKN